ncbi:MAG: dihydrofolate reductase family protein [Acidimicrobiales bacterium]
MRLVVINHITLDGVMQAPARPDEDTRGDFSHGGWAIPRNDEVDEVMVEALGRRMGKPDGGLLLGRRSYEDMLSAWNTRGGPYKDALNAAPKFVVSSDPATKLDWPNSTLVHGDIPAAVADLKQSGTGDLTIMGSGRLIRSLLPHGLIDEFLLMIHPIVLGSGQRLFEPDNHVTELSLVDSTPTTKGVILATYQPY